MRILSRPMFKYGGPIKEGIMHGMRNGGRAALVGNPVYPQTGGREHHAVVKSALQYGSKMLPSIGRWWNKIKPTWPGARVIKQPSTKPIGMRGPMLGRTTSIPRTKWETTKEFAKQNPYWAYGGAGAGMTSGAIPGAVGGALDLGWRGLKQGADLLISDKYFDQDKWFKERELKKQLKEGELSADQKEIERLTKLLLDKKTPKDKVEALATDAKAERNKKLKSYLDMMGYDSAKKTAMSDALIDASALVQDATTEAGSLKQADWGKLINRTIQATSKRLDKPEQIREAVGLMTTKAAIEKDLEDPQTKELRRLQIEKGKKDLKGTSFFDEVSIAQKSGAGGQTATDRGARNVSADEGIKWRGNIISTEDFKDTFAENKEATGFDDVTIVENWVGKKIDQGLTVNDGNYTVGDYLVTIKDNAVVNVR